MDLFSAGFTSCRISGLALPISGLSGLGVSVAVWERLFIGALLVETLQMWAVLFSCALQNKRGGAFGARLRYRFIPKSKSAARITGATVKDPAAL